MRVDEADDKLDEGGVGRVLEMDGVGVSWVDAKDADDDVGSGVVGVGAIETPAMDVVVLGAGESVAVADTAAAASGGASWSIGRTTGTTRSHLAETSAARSMANALRVSLSATCKSNEAKGWRLICMQQHIQGNHTDHAKD